MFKMLRGVSNATSGYSGGYTNNPTYETVCAHTTGHAEVVQIEFDENVLQYDDLLRLFFHVHDPTTLNRQGNDIGDNYRSVIFYHDDKQKESAYRIIKEITDQKMYKNPVVTQVVPFVKFWPAEEYHQDYYMLRGKNNAYCQSVVAPHVAHFMKQFQHLLKDE